MPDCLMTAGVKHLILFESTHNSGKVMETKRYTAQDLLIAPRLKSHEPGLVTRVTPEEAGWELLSFEVRRFQCGERWEGETGDCEAALVVLGGKCSVSSNKGVWLEIGRRRTVFEGMPWALYLPQGTRFTLTALTDGLEVAHAWAPVRSDEEYPARLITPQDSEIEIRGGRNATRQINSIIPPGFPCHRLVCVEVYTPGGNWSSYPPHKHDVHREDEQGHVLEADLEEIYFYKFDKPQGFAFQRVYAHDGSFDVALVAREDDLILVPEGYHPVSAAYGYTCYYLNFLAGSAQSLASSDDPDHTWVKETWDVKDPRLPIVSHEMEREQGLR